MCETCLHTNAMTSRLASYRYDPTRTTALRNAFAVDMKNRFNELIKVVITAIVEEDCFGMNTGLRVQQMVTPGNAAFAFTQSADKIAAFERWLQNQINAGVLDIRTLEQAGVGTQGAWTNRYVFDSYKRGVMRARYELQKAGFGVPSIEQTGGIEVSMGTPFHMDRIGLLYGRAYSGLKGITAAMDSQISQVLTQGMADGDNPRLLASKLKATINGTGIDRLGITDTLGRFIPGARRAEMLARTEIIRAHHVATIQEYRNWGADGVRVKAEWATVGDGEVCEKCAQLQGKVFPLNVIENMIPAHTHCRCIALPTMPLKGEKTKGGKIAKAIVSPPIPKLPTQPWNPNEISMAEMALTHRQEAAWVKRIGMDVGHVEWYTEEGYQYVNPYLRTGVMKTIRENDLYTWDDIKAIMPDLARAFESAPKYEYQCFRGMTMGEKEGAAFLEKLQNSKLLTDNGYMSTSMSKDVATEFGTGSKPVKILCNIKSKNGVAIDQISSYPEQLEVVFKPGSTFKLRGMKKTKDYTEIFLEE